jgi:DNA-binding response OmpR family regulator
MSHRPRILIIDDSPTSLVWQLVLLQEEEYDTLTANTSAEGVRIARMELPDLVILDAPARYDEVVAAATELRADSATSHIPVMIVSGSAAGRAASDIASVSDERVDKPLDRVEYLYKIRELLARRRPGGGRR